jgi:hypothetical protein
VQDLQVRHTPALVAHIAGHQPQSFGLDLSLAGRSVVHVIANQRVRGPVPERREYQARGSSRRGTPRTWAPDEDVAAQALRNAIDGRDQPAASARDRLAASFTWPQAAARLTGVLADLHAERGRPF